MEHPFRLLAVSLEIEVGVVDSNTQFAIVTYLSILFSTLFLSLHIFSVSFNFHKKILALLCGGWAGGGGEL